MKHLLLLLLTLFVLSTPTEAFSQFPDLEFSIENTVAQTSSTADVSFYAGTNWQNITSFSGTVTFDTTKITWNSMSFWGLSNPGGATFNYLGGGVMTFTWTSLITIGPTLSPGATIFTLRFNTVGSPGDVSPVNFLSSPQVAAWQNGFGWSGNNFLQSNGSVTLTCGVPVTAFTSTGSNYTYAFAETGSGATSYFWDFGDGNTSTIASPSHTYAALGSYTVCLVTTNVCGSDSSCGSVSVTCPLPGVAFSESISGLTTTFSDQTTNSPTAWFWDFGDGNTSTQQNPIHAYSSYNSYLVCLTTTNACGIDSACGTVNVICPVPVATYSQSATNLLVQFTDQTTNAPTSWLWDFGDGNVSTQQNPNHAYAAPGNYLVCLSVASTCGSDSVCTTVTASCPAPSTAFSQTSAALQVQFVDMTTGGAAFWLWDFGDGNTSSLQNPLHTYASAGSYTVCLVTTSICGSDSSCSAVIVLCPPPVATFSETSSGLAVQFSDLTTNTPTTWLWDFGDGNTSTMQNPSHTYASAGSYLTCLTVVSACGSDSTCSSVTVSCPAPGPAYSHTATLLVVQFTDLSTNTPTGWAWDFGDGNTSTQQSPTHTYATAGSYSVCLTASSACGSDSSCSNVPVIEVGTADPLSYNLDVYPNPATDVAWVRWQSDEEMQVQILDLRGGILGSYQGAGKIKLETAELAAGLYFVTIKTASAIFVRKLVLR